MLAFLREIFAPGIDPELHPVALLSWPRGSVLTTGQPAHGQIDFSAGLGGLEATYGIIK